MPCTSHSMATTGGANTQTIRRTTGATIIAVRSGCKMAMVLGRTSAKISTNSVMASVVSATPASPNIATSTLVAREAERMLTKLLPSKSAPSNVCFLSPKLRTICARRSPLRARWWMRARLAAVNAVSEPEKKAEMPSRITIARAGSHKVSVM